MRFQVPQFTDVEDKIVGPLTLKQFLYLAGATGACIVIFSSLPKWLAFPLMFVVGILGLALAFYKVNERPFIQVLQSFLTYTLKEKLYIWKHEGKKPGATPEKNTANPVFVPKLSESKLRDLTWSLDVKQNMNPVNEEEGNR